MFAKILVAADGSKHSFRAAEKAGEIAAMQEDAEVTVLYVVDKEKAKSDVLNAGDKETIDQRRKERLQPVEAIYKEKEVPFQTVICHGDPGPTIVTYANTEAFDLLVIGSRGLNTLQEMVLGSVSHKVAKRADCPVMIVK
ncbi:universal stress protein [Halobacillus sp. KGW1]|uniref:universal stress protein n=1 Tax=Halobacillus sp. KGW1 TaxID=1793726 RepID=UPI0007802162|nr:universal stress protein [Halobacillus sp. KGW1]